jgi:hypothetical protein
MKAIRKVARNPVLIFSLSFSLLLFSCGKESLQPNVKDLSGKELMQAIYFFDGKILDNIEPLKDLKLESLFETDQIAEIRDQIGIILNKTEELHPGTFASFKTEITSGDHLLISESITKNAILVHSVIKEMYSGNEAFTSLINPTKQPLAKVMESHFPGSKDNLTASDLKKAVKSEEFKKDMANYFKSLEGKVNGRSNQIEDQMCSIIVGAAVLVVAAIAVAVIYVVVILNAIETANIVHFVWALQRANGNSSLMKEQIVNSIADNLRAS